MTVDLGRVGIWTATLDSQPTAAAQESAAELDDLGYGALWIPEAVGRDPFVAAANLLAATKRIVLATGIANIYARDPMTMAASQKTLAEAYPGRFMLGLGVSHAHLVANLRKHDYSKPYSYMKDYLASMTEALFMAVGPDEDPPIVLAALGPKMLALSAEAANGAHPYFAPVEHTAAAREAMGPDALLAPEQMVVLESDAEKARGIARKGMAVYLRAPNYCNNLMRMGFAEEELQDGGSDRLVDAIVGWGDVDAIVARVAEQRAAGADHVCVQVLTADPAPPVEQWRELAPALLS